MINLDHISYRYPDQPKGCLDDLSLKICAGEAVCIMGPNGCGKSTLARLIAGLIAPSSGTVQVERPVSGQKPSLPIGLLFQDPDNQMVAALVDKEIAFALENLAVPVSEMKEIVSRELERFGITPLKQRLTTELSGGEKQRVALASLMVANPHVLILDEPDSYLDEAGRRMLTSELRRLHEEHPDLIEVRITQYPQVARTYRRLIVMFQGRAVADGNPAEILGNNANCSEWGLSLTPTAKTQFQIPEIKAGASGANRFARLTLQGVSFGYHDANILDNVRLSLERGRTVCAVGPSGSGKSTLGLLLCGLLSQKVGTASLVTVAGGDVALSDGNGAIAGLFQQPERQFFLPTCREEIAFGPANRGRHLDTPDIAALLSAVGLEPTEFLDRDPFTLSMGEKRRLAFAVVLALSPEFVVFDEPTCALDPSGVSGFIAMSQLLKEKQVGQFIISHDPDVVGALADQVLFLPGDGTANSMSPKDWFGSSRYRNIMPQPSAGISR
jgi:energy-coupling factor transporter ATP-binding protein EcfA2